MANIIVEDGSIVNGANSYVSIEDVKKYAADRGVNLPSEDDEVAHMLIKATDYLESLHCEFIGQPVEEDQPLEWPRENAYINCRLFPSNRIPKQLKAAQCQLVIAQHQGFDLQPNVSFSDYVTEEKIGPITTKYSDPASLQIEPTLTAASSALAALTQGACAGGAGGFIVSRV